MDAHPQRGSPALKRIAIVFCFLCCPKLTGWIAGRARSLSHSYVQPESGISSLNSCKVNKSLLDVDLYQADMDTVADIEALVAVYDAAFDGRMESAYPRSFL
jgi:hypothetical protein